MFHYLGITFSRIINLGQVFVAGSIDRNNKETGDVAAGPAPIQYAGAFTVDVGTSGEFRNKPLIAVRKHKVEPSPIPASS